MIRSSVDLPQPDGPISETNSPGWTSRSMPSSASTSPRSKRFERFVDGDCGGVGRRSCHVLRRPADEQPLRDRDDAKKRIPSAAAMMFVAQRLGGELT